MKRRKSFLLRMNPGLYEQLEAWARQEFRSVNGQIEYLLKEAVLKRGRSPRAEQPDVSPDENDASAGNQ